MTFRCIRKRLSLILLAGIIIDFGSASDSTVVKYFPTDLTRGMLLDNPRDFQAVRGKSHFKAYYTLQGDLISVEYIPQREKRRGKLPAVDRQGLKMYRDWQPWQRRLSTPLEEHELKNGQYYGAEFDGEEHLSSVYCFDRTQQLAWIYRIRWNRTHTRSAYLVEALQNQELTDLDRFLFVPELSEMRSGWQALFELRSDGLPRRVEVSNELGQLLYYYEFGYGHDGPTRIIVADRFRSSGKLAGRHELYFQSGAKRPDKIVFYTPQREIIKSTHYVWTPGEVVITERDAEGSVSSKRVVNLSD